MQRDGGIRHLLMTHKLLWVFNLSRRSVFLFQWRLEQSKPEPVVVSYLVFIKQHSRSSQDYVHAAVPVLTTDRRLLCPAEEKVHFSVAYDNIDLPERLPGTGEQSSP